tara:strand:+ start:41 stop:679 length:639 start_codon:yes stop_codon:yes gene_type:complete
VIEDENIQYNPKGNKTLLVSFGGLQQKMGMSMFEFNSSVKNLKVDSLFVKDPKRIWYQNGISQKHNSVESTVELIKSYSSKYQTTICIGNSAGAFAAILFGTLLNVNQVVAFSPQTLLSKDLKDFPWMKELDNLYKNDMYCVDLKYHLSNINYSTKIDVCVPVLNSFDSNQFDHIKDMPNVKMLPFNTADHNMGGYIKHIMGLDKFLNSYIS